MPFFMVDDRLHVNRKSRALVEDEGAVNGGFAIGVWTLAGSQVQDVGTDGVVSTSDLVRLLLDKPKALRAAKLLVKHGLWHAHGHSCAKCIDPPEGSFIYHDWWAMKYAAAAKVREERAKKAELKDPEIVEAVWLRDGENCRYCGKHVRRKDTRSEHRPTLDHVVPGMARGVGNLVIACKPCNQKKMQRTPEQAGMTLLAPPNPRAVEDDELVTSRLGVADQGQTTPTRPQSADGGSGRGPDVVSAVPLGTGTGTGDGSGSGSGLGTGQGTGQPTGAPHDGPPRAHRRDLDDHGTAGPAPDPGVPAQFGSPWAGWTGPPPEHPPPESWCPTHNDHQPCRRCAAEARGDTGP